MSAYRKAGGNERVVDLAGHTLLPGLIDCHVHFVYSGFRSLEEIDRCPVETAAINAVVNGGLMLDAGYTTVRDVGTIGNVAVAVRDAIAAGKVRGPRVIASGQIIGPTSGMMDTLPSHWSTSSGLGVCVDGPAAIVKEVRRQIKNGVDNIKLGASGVEVGRYAYTWMTTLNADEIAAAVAEHIGGAGQLRSTASRSMRPSSRSAPAPTRSSMARASTMKPWRCLPSRARRWCRPFPPCSAFWSLGKP
jgi:imidazolonepropionase-like amidohydrolase